MGAVTEAAPDTRVILLAPENGVDSAIVAIAKGAAGCLSRGIELDALARAVEGVAMGEAAISRTMALRLIQRVRELSVGFEGMRPVKSELTSRQWEVVDLLKRGASTAEIAQALVVSPETVHSHVQHILRKLGAHSRAEAVEIAERSRSGLPTSMQQADLDS
jgi:two-component system, NarL family, response regulator LiaR